MNIFIARTHLSYFTLKDKRPCQVGKVNNVLQFSLVDRYAFSLDCEYGKEGNTGGKSSAGE